MLACVYPGLFLHTHTYTQFALLYPLLIISHPSPPALSPPLSSPFSFPSGVREGYVNGQGGGLRKRREECERGERCCGGHDWVIIFPGKTGYTVCVCVCSVTFLQVCAYVWVGVEVCTFQLTSAFTCACVWAWLCVSMCLCAFRCVSVISCMSYIQLGQITLFSNDHTTTILYFWSLAPNPPLDSFSNLELRANNLPLCFMNPFTIQEG